jgi:hypothetical protein
LFAVMTMLYVFAVPEAGVPLRVAVPSPLSVKLTPLGSAPVSESDGCGLPDVFTVKFPASPTVNVALSELVIAGASFTAKVKLCVVLPDVLWALMVIGYEPPVPADGVPLSVPVPLPLSVKFTPLGSEPVYVRVGVGDPVVVTVNDPAVPAVNVVLVALVKTGAVFTVSVKSCVAGVPTELFAVMTKG